MSAGHDNQFFALSLKKWINVSLFLKAVYKI